MDTVPSRGSVGLEFPVVSYGDPDLSWKAWILSYSVILHKGSELILRLGQELTTSQLSMGAFVEIHQGRFCSG
jgi:hypothetical protein